MSSALARARNRRAAPSETINTAPPSPVVAATTPRPTSINDIFNTIKVRLDGLETEQNVTRENASFSEELIVEYESRFELILKEITEMKDLIMKVQSFTMEVNKSLYNDRIHILSAESNSSIEHEVINLNNASIKTIDEPVMIDPTVVDPIVDPIVESVAESEVEPLDVSDMTIDIPPTPPQVWPDSAGDSHPRAHSWHSRPGARPWQH
jgi:hypothetical protein